MQEVKKKKEIARVISQREIAEGVFDMWIETSIAKQAKAGQFISVYPNNQSTLLPRPISICMADEDKLRIVYRIAGKGTTEFSSYQSGDEITVLGTLGNGYDLSKADDKTVCLLGGGIGIPPMLQLAKCLKERGKAKRIVCILGYRDNSLFLKEEFDQYADVYVATEDGSAGTKGNVMDVIKSEGIDIDVMMSCGPMPMLRAIKAYADEKSIPAYISLEERMACGVGACLGCIVKTKEKDHHSHVNNARICTDGPVFLASDLDM